MFARICVAALPAVLLAACGGNPGPPDGSVILDEKVALVRGAHGDCAQRDFTVQGDSIIVAFADEQMADIKLKLSATTPDKAAITPVEVENNLQGAGVEVATLEVPAGSHLSITLTGTPDATTPGIVNLRVQRFRAHTGRDSAYAPQIAAFRAWSAATDARLGIDTVKATALPALANAITALAPAEPALSAQARLTRANMLHFFKVDMEESRAEAQRAAAAFTALAPPAAHGAARAQYIEALALLAMTADSKSVNPTAAEAAQLARDILTTLIAAESPLTSVERARATGSLGDVDFSASALDDAQKHFEQAQAIFNQAGYRSGEREMLANLAMVLLERGRFEEAAHAFQDLLPDVARISNPGRRVMMYLNVARAKSFSGRPDEAVEIQLEALALARQYKLRVQEANALHGLAHIYQNRGDQLQARSLIAEVLRITREEHDTLELVWGLASAGVVAREDGDFVHAIEMHKEAVSLATNPIARVRTMRELGLDYYSQQDYPAAIAQFRGSLATPLQDPRHHAYSDVKRNLAQTLIADGDLTPAKAAEVAQLVRETLASSLKVGDKLGEIGAHRVNAQLLAKQGWSTAALAEFDRTFELARQFRESSSSAEARVATLTHEEIAFRGYLDMALKNVVARGAGKPLPASKLEEAALRRLELAREVKFGAIRTGELDRETLAQVDALLAQMADKSLKIAVLLRSKPSGAEVEELATLQAGMTDLHAELDRVRTVAAAKAGALSAHQTTTRELRKLGPGVVQLSYALGEKHVYAWARSESGVLVAMLAPAPKELERELTQLGDLDRQSSPAQVERGLDRVSAILLPQGLLPKESQALEIVAEGRIAGVPFPGLRSQANPERRLIETHAITMTTSMFSIEEPPRSQLARPFRLVALASGSGTLRSAAIADPLPKLNAAKQEIRAVADLFVARDKNANIKLLAGADGSAAALRDIWGSGSDVVHFATHALADLRQPAASLLVLPAIDANGKSTYLTAGQVQEWRGDVELVFLSACESAIGPPQFAAGMPGLQRAFLRAGAHGVIATLWPIEDVLAKEFSADFYQRYTSGKSAVEALSETQRAWLAPKAGANDDEQMRRRITALAHAYFAK